MIGTGIQAECNESHAAELSEPSRWADPVTAWTLWVGDSPAPASVGVSDSPLPCFSFCG